MADNFTPGDDDSLLAKSALGAIGPDELDDDSEDDENERILEEAKKRFKLCEDAENDIRRQALEDLEFRAGKQWHDLDQQSRAQDGRPCLVINRIPQFVQQITNDQRQNRPAIKVHPVDQDADEETAKIIQGLIRHIEYNSKAEIAYDTAFESAVIGGFGYYRIITDFADPESFDQEIFIKRIRNPFSVYFDPYSQEPDGADASFAIIVDDLSPEEYRTLYPDSKLASPGMWESTGNTSPGWLEAKSARVAEYFYKEIEEVTLCLLADGTVIRKDEIENLAANLALQASAANPGQPVDIKIEIIREREAKIPVIKWVKLNAIEVLEKTEWPGKYIPVIPVYGQELYINGKRTLEGIVRNSKDAQRMYNYWKSAETEAIALAPRAPFLVAEGQIEGYEQEWSLANKKNHAYLTYKATDTRGNPLPPPQRQAVEPAVQAITQASMMAADDLKATTGLYDASMGAQSPDVSGVAIQRRSHQSQTSNFHFNDNLTRSMQHGGRVLIDLIPRIYDTARAGRILKEDGTQEIVPLNQQFIDPDTGKPVLYDLTAGHYDVTVEVGPSFASKRQEAAASMMDFSRSVPQVAQACADLIAKNMDWPGASEIAERLRKMLPPELQDDGKNKDVPPQVQAQMQQMHQMIQSLTDHLNETTKIIETKKLDLEHRERIEIMKLQTEAEIQMAKMGSNESMALLKAQLTEMEHRLSMLAMNQPINAPQDFDPQSADGGNYAGFGHVGGSANVPGGETPALPTGGQSPGQPLEGPLS